MVPQTTACCQPACACAVRICAFFRRAHLPPAGHVSRREYHAATQHIAGKLITFLFDATCMHPPAPGCKRMHNQNKNRSHITPDPGGHRPQRPCAQGRTCAKQDQAQASAPGQSRTEFVGGATTHGRRTRQAGKSVPTQTRPGAGGCTPQSTPQEGALQRIYTTGHDNLALVALTGSGQVASACRCK